MPNKWITFVKDWATKNNTTYGCALSKPEMKSEYQQLNPKPVKVKKAKQEDLTFTRPYNGGKPMVLTPENIERNINYKKKLK
jgi:hypothetical protein